MPAECVWSLWGASCVRVGEARKALLVLGEVVGQDEEKEQCNVTRW
jgi:hypothetical protein